MAGSTAGSKTLTLTDDQNAAVKLLLSVMLKDAKYKVSSSGGLGPANVSENVASQNNAFNMMLETALQRLKSRDYSRAFL
jgi:hypothetical protein